MKKFLWISLMALAFASCENVVDDVDTQAKGELEQSYVAISLTADPLNTRATGTYEEGRNEERAVKSAYVFFFKDGVAFPVTFNTSTSTSTNEGTSNYLQVELTGNSSAMDNVSDVKDAVLVLQNYKGEYPNQIVAVLNWTPTQTSYTLAELREVVSNLGDDTNGYIMSNAVYMDGAGQTVDAQPLTVSNIGKTATDALSNPVTIHVERVAAKVEFTAANSGKFDIEKQVGGKAIYAQIKGFELYNDYKQSWLMKRIDPTWADMGFNWNDESWFRSYWAESLNGTFASNTFAWNTDNTAMGGYVYCGENTRDWQTNDVRTKVVVKAQLVDDAGHPVEVVNWYGKDYIGEDDLKTVVANTLKNTYFSGDGSTFTGLTPDDIMCVARDVSSEKAYEVYFQLSPVGTAKNWYKYVGGTYNAIADDVMDTQLAGVQPALVYKEGMTYYWLDIKHLGAPGKTAEYGIVRNHVYKVNITDITGFGTPVYNGTTDYINLEKPADIVTYVSAQINVLSWRVVDNNYELN
jgi:hypothetical protein